MFMENDWFGPGILDKVIQNVFQLMNVHKDNVVTTNIGMNVDHTVMKISVAQQWVITQEWNQVSDHSGMQSIFENESNFMSHISSI